MRTLTLGVLIVAGGTLAALPFRRFPAPPDASQGPSQATGPVLSELDGSPRIYAAASAGIADPASSLSDPAQLQQLVDTLPRWHREPLTREIRRVDIPLTFDDLAAPIEYPQPLQERFAATAEVQQQLRQQEPIAPREQQPVADSMVAAVAPQRFTPLPTQPAAEQSPLPTQSLEPQPAASRATASLASAARSEAADPLPKPVEPVREKHWIRQP